MVHDIGQTQNRYRAAQNVALVSMIVWRRRLPSDKVISAIPEANDAVADEHMYRKREAPL